LTQAPRIAIVGAGLGGLTAAAAMRRHGLDVTVYEQAPALGEIGAGIQISPNASRLLHRLGLGDALAKHGVRPVGVHQRRWQDGRTLQRAPLGDLIERTFGAPYYHFHRADLLAALARAVPSERVHLGHRFAGYEDDGNTVAIRFENGATAQADVLVGADGIHSAVRAQLFGPERPRFTGCIAYRGLVPAERLKHLELEILGNNWMGPGGHFVHYFVAGARFVNFVAVQERDTWMRESWTDPGRVEDALALFADWHPQIRSIIGAVDQTFIWALHDRMPLEAWGRSRVTLLGDSCHAMLPFMAQGAAQSIEDGAALAQCLMRWSAAEALKRYETIRRPRATRLQEMSRANKTRFHLPDGPEQEARDAQMANAGDRQLANIGWLYAHDAAVIEEAH
jgi:salicylate hydroxylase